MGSKRRELIAIALIAASAAGVAVFVEAQFFFLLFLFTSFFAGIAVWLVTRQRSGPD